MSEKIRLKSTKRDQKTPSQFRKFLANSQNNVDPVRFPIEVWTCHMHFIRSREIYAIDEDKTFVIKLHNGVPGKKLMVALESNEEEEEADTKVRLCAQFAITLDISSITIAIVDSDIYILALFYSLYLEIQMVL